MKSKSWDLLEELYGQVRVEEIGAWEDLKKKAIPMLQHWVLKHLDVGKLSPWELEDIVLESFEEATRRRGKISTWLEAWEYSRQTVLRKVLRRVNRVKIHFMPLQHFTNSFDPVDPFSMAAFQAVDFVEAFEGFLKIIDRDKVEFLSEFLEAVLNSPATTLAEIAARIGVSERTLDGRVRELKYLVARKLKY